MCCSPDCFLAFIAVLFPPIAVWVKVGVCSADSLINIALLVLGYVPGLLHAWYIILKYPEDDLDYPDGYRPIVGANGQSHDTEGGRVAYYFISHRPPPPSAPHGGPSPQPHRSYGTTAPVAHPAASSQQPSHPSAPGANGAGEGSSSGPHGAGVRAPPTYAEAVKGDHKIQTPD
ncbi:conserved hypothetical protein [Histoplasma capsulatum G186AR]|uniref:Stress response RCI peptide n=2 Tax=Ajellomyces capsulatus TaxID=5037 RepID=C0NP50_AJECG|nr:uncharacterized protein HCBG_04930 [Histoplasma capsulatum G186AR]EEH06710.1 conserved hypothetical protein [Histoplasma capsulatum G186AR]KAG5304757.1 stress response RCI peptide [Histoplasma capsulatum]QSS75716.1 stress response RCI peptide [Histoplasma capsulatum G186AR]